MNYSMFSLIVVIVVFIFNEVLLLLGKGFLFYGVVEVFTPDTKLGEFTLYNLFNVTVCLVIGLLLGVAKTLAEDTGHSVYLVVGIGTGIILLKYTFYLIYKRIRKEE